MGILDTLYFDGKRKRDTLKALEGLWKKAEVPGGSVTIDALAEGDSGYGAVPQYDLGIPTYGKNQDLVESTKLLAKSDPTKARDMMMALYDPVQQQQYRSSEETIKGQQNKNVIDERLLGLLPNYDALANDGTLQKAVAGPGEERNLVMALQAQMYPEKFAGGEGLGQKPVRYAGSYIDENGNFVAVGSDMIPKTLGVVDPKFRVQDIGGRAITTGIGHQPTVMYTPEQMGAGEGTREVYKEEMVRRWNDAQAVFDDDPSALVALIDEAANHPGFNDTYGVDSALWTAPGSKSADFQGYVEQIQGALFKIVFESMKGGGSIQLEEGNRALASISRLANYKMDNLAAKKAFEDVKRDVLAMHEKAKARAAANFIPTSPSGMPAFEILPPGT